MKKDKLEISARGQRFVLTPTTKTRFLALKAPNELSVDFILDEKGRTHKAKITVEGEDRNLVKAPKLEPLTAAQLKEYAGEYYNDEIPVTYKLAVEKEALVFKHKNAPKSKFKTMSRDKFTAGWFNIEFVRNKRKKITGFVLGAGRAANIEFVKK